MRQEQLAKISELLSDPTSCKLGLEMLSTLKVTPQEMCHMILKSNLNPIEKIIVGKYLLIVDERVFSRTEFLPIGTLGEFTLREIKLAKWKTPRMIDSHDDADHFSQSLILAKVGVYGEYGIEH